MNIETIQKIKSESNGFVELVSNLKDIGVIRFVVDAKTASMVYYGNQNEVIEEQGPFNFEIGKQINISAFRVSLKAHQRGETDFPTWLSDTTKYGIASWEVLLLEKTCTYFDCDHNALYVEKIPAV